MRNIHPELFPLLVKTFLPIDTPASYEECQLAEKLLIKEAQMMYPPSDDTKNTLRIYMNPYGLLKCRGRFPEQKKRNYRYFPLYFLKEAALTSLIIKDMHIQYHHCGPTTLMAIYRSYIYTPQLRRLIRKVILQDPITKCIECYRYLAKPCHEAEEPALTKERIKTQAPFQQIGVDFFGPFRV
jgi:hypothetical protein